MEAVERPLFSYLLLTYNQERYIEESVISAFAQTYSPLEIIISDDCSSDSTFNILNKLVSEYRGPHKVILNRNHKNLGIVQHLNLVVSLSSGEMLIGGAGDDLSTSDRTSRIYDEWLRLGKDTCSIFSDAILINADGHQMGNMHRSGPPKHATTAEEAISQGTGVFGCSHAFSRQAFDCFGPIKYTATAEDMVIPFRSLVLGQISYIDAPLVFYRIHGQNISIGSPSRKKRYNDAVHQEFALLNWLHDVLVGQETGILSLDRAESLAKAIYSQLHICSLEKMMYRQSLWQVGLLLVKEMLNTRNVKSLLKIYDRRRRCV